MSTSIERGKDVVRIEMEALQALGSRIDESFATAVDLIANSTGRVIVAILRALDDDHRIGVRKRRPFLPVLQREKSRREISQ